MKLSRRGVLGTAAAAALPAAPVQAQTSEAKLGTPTLPVELAPLVGSWRLLAWANRFSDTGEREETFGPNPEGRMVFEPGGRIMFLFMKPNRQMPATDADRAALLGDMVAYTGLVRPDGPGRFVTTVDFSWIPFPQKEQLRFYKLDGDRLEIRTSEHAIPRFPGRLLVGEIVWIREHPAA